jgi:hypothetical protein
MSDETHVELARNGDRWTAFRKSHPTVIPDLRDSDFEESMLRGDFSGVLFDGAYMKSASFPAQLNGASFVGARMRYARLDGSPETRSEHERRHTNFQKAHLTDAALRNADFSFADFSLADMRGAVMENALLVGANFTAANMLDCRLDGADLTGAVFRGTAFRNTNMSETICANTTFDAVDLSRTVGLHNMVHQAPSAVSLATLIRSGGRVPLAFLAGTHPDVPETELKTLADALRTMPFEFDSCFISYAHADMAFVDALSHALSKAGVRFWRDATALLPGENFEERITNAITRHDRFLVVLSGKALEREWVAKEIEIARRIRPEQIVPIRLDDAVLSSSSEAGDFVRRALGSRHITDFSAWRNAKAFAATLAQLLTALRRD